MNAGDLLGRVYDQLNGNTIFWTPEEIFSNGICPAQRLLCLLKPTLLTKRVAVDLQPHEVFIDLRVVASRSFRVQRVSLGDITGDVPVPTQGRTGDLRKTSLASLRSERTWFTRTKAFPESWYTHGIEWVCLFPRATQALTVTIVSSVLPAPLVLEAPTVEPETPRQWDAVISDIATCLLQCKEGAGETEQAVERLQKELGEEPFKQLQKMLVAERRRQQYGGMRASA